MNTVNVHLILFGKPYKIAKKIIYRAQISDRNHRHSLLIYKLIIPSQTVFGKIVAGLAKGFRRTSNGLQATTCKYIC